jgi:hypothetical protein
METFVVIARILVCFQKITSTMEVVEEPLEEEVLVVVMIEPVEDDE